MPCCPIKSFATALCCLLMSSCEVSSKSSNAEDPDADPVDSSLPGPRRAAAAAARVKPLLEPKLKAAGLDWGGPVFLRIFKQEETLELWMQPEKGKAFKLFKSYPIQAFSGKLGPKEKEGDRQAPEGFYRVRRRSMNPASRYHLSFDLGYPNAYDRAHERTGSHLMVHGNRVSIGCYAMGDLQIEEIYSLCDAALLAGQPFFRVHCFPFHLSDSKLATHANSPWLNFWENLQQGYAYFEEHRLPPDTTVRDKLYHFE